MAPRTVHHYRRVLIKALGQAVTWERLTRNPAVATTPPKVERKKMLAYDISQTASLLETLRPTPHVHSYLACGDVRFAAR
ncbi:hypothetical protein [Mesorhizobium sp.]|uniref:hypothetical protein n=1 Tax=Mesorhizobium sp. TaxID=1871066 RepID=UPI002580B5D1|nr:hypothetical protein [Mesorhizobium sp.]